MKNLTKYFDKIFVTIHFSILHLNESERRLRRNISEWLNQKVKFIIAPTIIILSAFYIEDLVTSSLPLLLKLLFIIVLIILNTLIVTTSYLAIRRKQLRNLLTVNCEDDIKTDTQEITTSNKMSDSNKNNEKLFQVVFNEKESKKIYSDIVREIQTKDFTELKNLTEDSFDFTEDEKLFIKSLLLYPDNMQRICNNVIISKLLEKNIIDDNTPKIFPLHFYVYLVNNFENTMQIVNSFIICDLFGFIKDFFDSVNYRSILLKNIVKHLHLRTDKHEIFTLNSQNLVIDLIDEIIFFIRKNYFRSDSIEVIGKQINHLTLIKSQNKDYFLELPIQKLKELISDIPNSQILTEHINENIKDSIVSFLQKWLTSKDSNTTMKNIDHLINLNFSELKEKTLVSETSKKIDIGRILFQLKEVGVFTENDLMKIYEKNIITRNNRSFLVKDDFKEHNRVFKKAGNLYKNNDINIPKLIKNS